MDSKRVARTRFWQVGLDDYRKQKCADKPEENRQRANRASHQRDSVIPVKQHCFTNPFARKKPLKLNSRWANKMCRRSILTHLPRMVSSPGGGAAGALISPMETPRKQEDRFLSQQLQWMRIPSLVLTAVFNFLTWRKLLFWIYFRNVGCISVDCVLRVLRRN